jgi:hypothetical protein
MKKIVLCTMSLLLTTGFSLSAMAQDATPAADTGATVAAPNTLTDQTPPSAMMSSTPCKNIRSACESAGYSKNGTEGKHMWKDCLKPVLLGQSIAGVTVDAGDVQACRQKVAAKMQKNANQMAAPMATPAAAPAPASTTTPAPDATMGPATATPANPQ